jgi:hypothetical protein
VGTVNPRSKDIVVGILLYFLKINRQRPYPQGAVGFVQSLALDIIKTKNMTTKKCFVMFMGIILIGLVSCKSVNKKPEEQFIEGPSQPHSGEYVNKADEIVDSEVVKIPVEKTKVISPNRIIDAKGKVGSITANTTKSELEELYGKENISETVVFSYEGIDVVGSQVRFENNNDNFYIIWNEDNLTPQTIIIKNENSNWKTKDGIGIGSTLREVEKANGTPFDIHPLAEIDVYLAGTVQNWNSGSFTKSGLNVQFKITNDLPDLPMEEYYETIGGGSSNNDRFEKLG